MFAINEEIANLEAALRGETVNGVKIGDAGITKEWVENTLASLKAARDGPARSDLDAIRKMRAFGIEIR